MFCLVGLLNTAVGAAIMFGLYNLAHCSYWFSTSMNYVVGGIISFLLNKRFTFKSEEKSISQVLRFILTIAVCYVLAYSIAQPLVKLILSESSVSVRDNVAMFAGMIIYTVLNFLGQKFFAFKEKDVKSSAENVNSENDKNT